jgi:hypothetical protein
MVVIEDPCEFRGLKAIPDMLPRLLPAWISGGVDVRKDAILVEAL